MNLNKIFEINNLKISDFLFLTLTLHLYPPGIGLVVALQSVVTVRVLKNKLHFSMPVIVRIGVFMAFLGTFFLAFAETNAVLLTG